MTPSSNSTPNNTKNFHFPLYLINSGICDRLDQNDLEYSISILLLSIFVCWFVIYSPFSLVYILFMCEEIWLVFLCVWIKWSHCTFFLLLKELTSYLFFFLIFNYSWINYFFFWIISLSLPRQRTIYKTSFTHYYIQEIYNLALTTANENCIKLFFFRIYNRTIGCIAENSTENRN